MKLGLVGLPASGKTTVFNAVIGLGRPVGGYHAGASLDLAAMRVPEPRMARMVEIYSPKKITFATLDVVDVTGLISGEGRTEVDREVLGKVRDLDALALVLRAFDSGTVLHTKGSVDPARDLDLIRTELIFADLAVAEGRRERLEKDAKRGKVPREQATREIEFLGKVIVVLEEGRPARDADIPPDYEKLLRGFQFLTKKPEIVIANTGDAPGPDSGAPGRLPPETVVIPGALDMELAGLVEPERSEFAKELGMTERAAETFARAAYGALGLRTFLTGGPTEVHAWTIRAGATASEAAGAIHTDMARGFIRAEVVSFADLSAAGSEQAAKAAGKMRLEGRDYVVADGDVLNVRFGA